MTDSLAGKKPFVWMNVTTSANWTRAAVGIVRVEKELARELSLLYEEGEFGLCIFRDGEFVPYTNGLPTDIQRTEAHPLLWPDTSRRFPKSSTFDPTFGVRRRIPPPRRSQTQASPQALSLALDSQKARRSIRYGDIIISVGLDWDHPYVNSFQALKDIKGVKLVTFCHDLIPVLFPQYCVGSVSAHFKDYFTKISWASSLILCNSLTSQRDYRDLMRKIGAPEVDSAVIPLGDNVPTSIEDRKENGTNVSPEVASVIEQPFILFVSTIERRKNHEVLYRAYHLLARAGHAKRLPKLVFVGMPGWGVGDLLKDIELDPLTNDLIILFNHVTDGELRLLYERAYFCAYPSLYEGWGLPVGEALACGKAIIASGEGSIPEVGGGLVTYLDPWDPKAWAEEILALVNEPGKVQAMEAAVRGAYQRRTWHGTAEAVKAAIAPLLEQKPVSITLYPGYDMHTLSGVCCGEAIRSIGSTNILTHGPYRALPAGLYDFEIFVDKVEGAAGRVFFSIRSAGGMKEHASIGVPFDSQEHFDVVVRMRVELEKDVEDYEIYSEVSSNILVEINRITIQSILA